MMFGFSKMSLWSIWNSTIPCSLNINKVGDTVGCHRRLVVPGREFSPIEDPVRQIWRLPSMNLRTKQKSPSELASWEVNFVSTLNRAWMVRYLNIQREGSYMTALQPSEARRSWSDCGRKNIEMFFNHSVGNFRTLVRLRVVSSRHY